MSDVSPPAAPGLMRFLGALAILGALTLVVGNIVASAVVPGHDWVADTVSDLAAGRYEIIQDVTLYAYAAAAMALGLGLAHLHPGARGWSGAILAQMFIALCVIVIGARNEYGDGDNDGIVIHIYVVYAMGAAYVAGFAASALALREAAPGLARGSWLASGLWAVGAPVFFMIGTAYDGAFERALGIVSVAWTCAMGGWFIRLSRG
ncbi:DUF998 domain-containing protein [Sulfitobacter albidus]|uniref:DUF998 domain-containing protein n=1 Tax=Sulfitobacter albidus TaxID=2829501 RepID=A0A975JBV4_9RHOB|nr:DUF998 domain-containing protein [Sulfitobacter albidus]QUJ75568.1 DUF998 domain-containing protein [Sulfitobacter albidus]